MWLKAPEHASGPAPTPSCQPAATITNTTNAHQKSVDSADRTASVPTGPQATRNGVARSKLPTPEAFDRFHADNPIVFETLVRLLRDWQRRTGRSEVSISMIFETARWEIALATSDPDFKINNNYRSYFARLIGIEHPELSGAFQNRRSEADGWAASYIRAKEAHERHVTADGGLFHLFPTPRDGGQR